MKFFDNNVSFKVEEHNGSSIATGKHFHSLYEFYYLAEGEVSYFIKDKTYSVKKGDVIVIPPSTIHNSIRSDKERRRILFYLSPDYLQGFYSESIPQRRDFVFHTEGNRRIRNVFEELLRESRSENNSSYNKALVCELMVLLLRLNDDLKTESNNTRINEIVAYINERYYTDLTLEGTAKTFYMNPSYLSRLFKTATGFNFNEYLNKYRIKEANNLLITTSKSITEIAGAVGYNSSTHFCKTFKRIMGVSPLSYKKGDTRRER